jgi:hypothetical protein
MIIHAVGVLGSGAVRVLVALLLLGCSEPASTPDAAPAADLGVPAALTLFVGATARPMDAYYSMMLSGQPGEPGEPAEPTLLITLVDPSFHCTGVSMSAIETVGTDMRFPSDFPDAVFEAFQALSSGTGGLLLGRRGPLIGPTVGHDGYAELGAVDLRYLGADGGIIVGDGGSASGEVRLQLAPDLSLVGPFQARHCADLDVVIRDRT